MSPQTGEALNCCSPWHLSDSAESVSPFACSLGGAPVMHLSSPNPPPHSLNSRLYPISLPLNVNVNQQPDPTRPLPCAGGPEEDATATSHLLFSFPAFLASSSLLCTTTTYSVGRLLVLSVSQGEKRSGGRTRHLTHSVLVTTSMVGKDVNICASSVLLLVLRP